MSKREPHVRLLHMRDYARKACRTAESHSRGALDTNEVLRLALTHLVLLERPRHKSRQKCVSSILRSHGGRSLACAIV